MGLFLATLHHYQDHSIDVDTGYLVTRHGVDQSCPGPSSSILAPVKRRKLEAMLKAIADNPANFVDPATIIHGDLYFSNIFWDKTNWVITGIIDGAQWDAGYQRCFIALADFTRTETTNSQDILRWYGADDTLFNQVKENAIIEVMSWLWFYEAGKDPKDRNHRDFSSLLGGTRRWHGPGVDRFN